MLYKSTREETNNNKKSASYVIMNGIAADGGLFVPESFPEINAEYLRTLCGDDYITRAAKILSLFLSDYTYEELYECARGAYSEEHFGKSAAPLVKADGLSILELWHGPTSAFKDMALQIMPRLLSLAIKKSGVESDALILVATSGDTGKAALEGYADAERVKIIVFYPSDGVSAIQKLQMATQQGENVFVAAVRGNFDDCQSGVKAIFADENAKKAVAQNGYFFSSANSINWGRLAPQIVYYISAYCDMVNSGEIAFGEQINVTVPTGNFGNILAAYIAKKMGAPIKTLVCASNSNNVLTDFFETGVYDRRRDFHTTISPSMDILISSNLERLLYFATSGSKCAEYMKALAEGGFFKVENDIMAHLRSDFAGYYASEEQTKESIGSVFAESGYLCDPHTAVAIHAAKEHMKNDGATKMLVVSTASPYKFSAAVLDALGVEVPENGFKAIDSLAVASNTTAPSRLVNLKNMTVRFKKTINAPEMAETVINSFIYGKNHE